MFRDKTEKTYLIPESWRKEKGHSETTPALPDTTEPPLYGAAPHVTTEEHIFLSGEFGRTENGLGIMLTTFFLVAQVAGFGVLALPWAIARTSWTGLLALVGIGVTVAVCGCYLGTCWVILEERWPEYRRACRKPYPAMALRTLGKPGWYFVNVIQGVTLFGVSIVTMLLTSELLQAVMAPLVPSLNVCSWLGVCGAILVPLSWLGTPKEFWVVSVVALIAAVAAVVVVVVKILLDLPEYEYSLELHSPPTAQSYFLGLGAMFFSYGGAVVFPTIQNDMRDRRKFPFAIIIAFGTLIAMYLPMATLGYYKFGSSVNVNILLDVKGPSVTAVVVLILFNNLFTYVLVVNPISQALEEAFSLPHHFGWQRCILRSSLTLVAVLIGLGVKNFGRILSLIGGFSVPILTFVLPPIFYIRLCDSSKDCSSWPARSIDLPRRVALYILISVGVIGCLVSTYTSLLALFDPPGDAVSCFG